MNRREIEGEGRTADIPASGKWRPKEETFAPLSEQSSAVLVRSKWSDASAVPLGRDGRCAGVSQE
jgi:hypothetical protein